MTFSESVSICLHKYFDFNGRAPRSEYWWFFLFGLLVYLGSLLLSGTANSSVFAVIALLALFFPVTAATAATRRSRHAAGPG